MSARTTLSFRKKEAAPVVPVASVVAVRAEAAPLGGSKVTPVDPM